MAQNYLEVVAAPDFEAGTVDILKKAKDLRIIKVPRFDRLQHLVHARYRGVQVPHRRRPHRPAVAPERHPQAGGLQARRAPPTRARNTAASGSPPTREYEDLLFGWWVEQGVTSNSVIFVKDGCTVGIGTGEQDRVGVAEIAIFKAYTKYADALCFKRFGMPYKNLELEILQAKRDSSDQTEIDLATEEAKGGLIGAVMISDAFFPFRDGVDVGIRQGITRRGPRRRLGAGLRVIEACNEADPPVAMVFTGQRAFKH